LHRRELWCHGGPAALQQVSRCMVLLIEMPQGKCTILPI
jgi:hypothetical protein